jgi:replicative DNA helicase
MNRDEAKAEIKGRLAAYLEMKGINPNRPFHCLNPAHDDRHPSMSFDKDGNYVYCFSCRKKYDVFDLIGIDYGLTDFKDQFETACDMFGITLDARKPRTAPASPRPIKKEAATDEQETDYTDFFREAHSRIHETDYAKRRGLSKDIIERFNLGYVPNWKHPKAPAAVPGSPRLIIPTSRTSYLARLARDAKNEKEKQYSKGKCGHIHLFNLDALSKDEPPFIVEGEIDALSIEELGHPAVALGTTAKTGAFIDYLKEHRPQMPVIIALDGDKAGKDAAGLMARQLKEAGILFYRPNGLYTAGKDANENLLNDREAFSERLETVQNEAMNTAEDEKKAARQEYERDAALNYVEDFLNGVKARANTPATNTGFDGLNMVLDGGLYEGLYCIGAISSLGKTTLILQIADQIAQSKQDVLIFSLEMARSELMAKSISRLTYEITIQTGGDEHNAKTARGITSGDRWNVYSNEELKLIYDAVDRYKEYAGHIYIFEGIGNIGVNEIRERVQRHVSFTGRRPVVIIDYLQILAPFDVRATDKQNTDKSVLELKRISRDNKIPVIAISSFNRENYKNAVGMQAFKESGAIEYSSDVLIGLQLEGAGKDDFDATEAKRQDPRHVELVVLKNRNGRVGDKVLYEYYPMFNYFRETDVETKPRAPRKPGKRI